MLFIGICGASGSGKTTLADELVRDMGVDSVVINQDAYYLDHPNLTFEERTRLNYDEPYIFDHDLLYNDVRLLMAGQEVQRKAYDFSEHRRAESHEIIHPADVLVGHLCFAWELVYPKSVAIMQEQGYVDQMLNRQFSNARPQATFAQLAAHMRAELFA